MATKINKKANNNIWIIAAIGIITLILFLVILQKQLPIIQVPSYQNITPANSVNITNYHSKFLKISFAVPQAYSVKESGNDITLKNNLGEISVLRIGTNNDSLEGYLFGLSDLNKLQIINKQKIKINQANAISCLIKSPLSQGPDEKAYFFYPAPWTIYSISTNSQELFSDLDQIARSFRYAP